MPNETIIMATSALNPKLVYIEIECDHQRQARYVAIDTALEQSATYVSDNN